MEFVTRLKSKDVTLTTLATTILQLQRMMEAVSLTRVLVVPLSQPVTMMRLLL